MNVNEQSSRGTVLRIAALRGNLDIVEWLLNEGNADVYVANISGLTAFNLCTMPPAESRVFG